MPAGPLDGRSFDGLLKAKGLLELMRGRTSLDFEQGTLAWSAGEDFAPAPYETRRQDGLLVFTARASGRPDGQYPDDHVDWSGVYDGESVRDVEAVWTRGKGRSRLLDVLLPGVVCFVFLPG